MERENQYRNIREARKTVERFIMLRKDGLDEENMNNFLDAILYFQKSLEKNTKEILCFYDKIQNLTWLSDMDEECLIIAKDLLLEVKDLQTFLLGQYDRMGFIRNENIAKDEIESFKNAIDKLTESRKHLVSAIFVYPMKLLIKNT